MKAKPYDPMIDYFRATEMASSLIPWRLEQQLSAFMKDLQLDFELSVNKDELSVTASRRGLQLLLGKRFTDIVVAVCRKSLGGIERIRIFNPFDQTWITVKVWKKMLFSPPSPKEILLTEEQQRVQAAFSH